MTRVTLVLTIGVVGIAVFLCNTAQAVLVNVDFGDKNQSNYSSVPYLGAYSDAAVIGSAGDIWNGVATTLNAISGNDIPLVDAQGGATSIKLAYACPQLMRVTSANWNALLDDQISTLATLDSSLWVTLSDLEPGIYDLYVYGGSIASNGNPNTPNPKKIELGLQVDDTSYGSVTLQSASTEYAFVEEANYGVFRNVLVDSGGILTITGVNRLSGKTAAFNGFQLMSVPEPSSMLMAIAGIIALLPREWRKRK